MDRRRVFSTPLTHHYADRITDKKIVILTLSSVFSSRPLNASITALITAGVNVSSIAFRGQYLRDEMDSMLTAVCRVYVTS